MGAVWGLALPLPRKIYDFFAVAKDPSRRTRKKFFSGSVYFFQGPSKTELQFYFTEFRQRQGVCAAVCALPHRRPGGRQPTIATSAPDGTSRARQ